MSTLPRVFGWKPMGADARRKAPRVCVNIFHYPWSKGQKKGSLGSDGIKDYYALL